MSSIYVGDVTAKIGLTFDLYDFNGDGIISREDVQLLLSYSELSLLMIDESLRKGKSPKEGKHSLRLNTYLSYVTRVS